MLKFQLMLCLTATVLAGCGQVAVFGHTIGERPTRASEDPTSASDSRPSKDTATTSQTQAEPAPASAVAAVAAPRAVSDVSLVLTSQATAKVADDSRFKTEALLAAIEAELRARKLLADANSSADSTAEISIEDFAVRPTSNAVVLGYIMNDGALTGEIRIRDAASNEFRSYRIEAESRLTVAANGSTPEPLGPLYRRFASLTGDWLAGTPGASKPSPVNNQTYR